MMTQEDPLGDPPPPGEEEVQPGDPPPPGNAAPESVEAPGDPPPPGEGGDPPPPGTIRK